ncbi:MAG TPA: hypothetical protein VHY37_00955 [Tepidisphaeraceae bacterium]|jgi:hypothetical protein|nr:hypothetical protein [Tepidisphaeraceae bacterium]
MLRAYTKLVSPLRSTDHHYILASSIRQPYAELILRLDHEP